MPAVRAAVDEALGIDEGIDGLVEERPREAATAERTPGVRGVPYREQGCSARVALCSLAGTQSSICGLGADCWSHAWIHCAT
jgi:hypothetical protein